MIEILSKKVKKAKKSRRLPDLTVNMWLSAMQEMQKELEDPIPEGYITLAEAMKIIGLCKSRTCTTLTKLRKAGKVHVVKIRRICQSGRLKPISVYKLISK